MAPSSGTPLLSPEEIAVRAGQQVPFLRLPERAGVFAEREMRLRQRAASHPMRDFLLFTAELARAQHEVLQRYPVVAMVELPDPAALEAASRLGAPPLPATLWPRDPAWRDGLADIIEALLQRLAGSPAEASVRALANADAAWLERQADRLLTGVMLGLDLAAAPLIAASLQTYWTHLVIATQQARGSDRLPPFGRVDDATACPCCGSAPVASVSRIGGDTGGYRYLHCSLCSAEWHMVRIKCARCQKTQGIHYQSLRLAGEEPGTPTASSSPRAPGSPAVPAHASPAAASTTASPASPSSPSSGVKPVVEAETCDSCGHYLKIVHMARDANVEPVADDLATVTLDLLVSDAGFQRHGVNLMLLFGDPNPDTAPDPTAAAAAPNDGGGG